MSLDNLGQRYAVVDSEGRLLKFLAQNMGPEIPEGAIPITEQQLLMWGPKPHGYRWEGTSIVEVVQPPPVPRPVYTRKIDIWSRATDEQAEALQAALNASPVRLQQIFAAADWILHDTADPPSANPFWPPLVNVITSAVGAEETARLLAPTES